MEEKIRRIVRSYFYCHGTARHQLESYNHFIEVLLPNIIREMDHIVIQNKITLENHVFFFNNVRTPVPMFKEHDGTMRRITPHYARLMNLTYAAPVLVDVVHRIYKGKTVLDSATGKAIEDEYLGGDDDSDAEGPIGGVFMSQISPQALGDLLSETVHKEVILCEVPVMVGSAGCYLQNERDVRITRECSYDPGGYFIINGNEKVVLAQESLRNNFPYINVKKDSSDITCEVRSWNENKIRSTSTLKINMSVNKGSLIPKLSMKFPFVEYDVPLAWVFRLVGVDTEEEMHQIITGYVDETHDGRFEHTVRCVLEDPSSDLTLDEICDIIGSSAKNIKHKPHDQRVRSVRNIVHNEFLPHMGLDHSPATMRRRAIYLGYIVRRMIRVYLKRQPPDDRDHYANKRLTTTGMLLAILFRQNVRTYIRGLRSTIQRAIDIGRFVSVIDFISPKRLTSALKYALSTGNWGVHKGGSNQKGVAQVLTRMSVPSMISHLRRVNTPANRQGKCPEPRQLHLSHRGILCPCETPEGESCGLITNLAMATHVRIGYPTHPIIDLVNSLGILISPEDARGNDIQHSTIVFVNGIIIGFAHDGGQLRDVLHRRRRIGDIPFDVSITFRAKSLELFINSDEGCCLRPLLVVQNLHLFDEYFNRNVQDIYTLWNAMLAAGIIEYLDKEEETTCCVCDSLEELRSGAYTHVELMPSLMFSICASAIPYPEHNQAPRNMYQSSMGKQAITIPTSNFMDRFETKVHVLCYPQRPLVTTAIAQMLKHDDLPQGQNVVVLILAWSGYNQEDAILMRKSFGERGGGRSFVFQTVRDTESTRGTDKETFEKPDSSTVGGLSEGKFNTIDNDDGLPRPGTLIRDNDAIVGKVMTTGALKKTSREDVIRRDRSTFHRGSETMRIDKVLVAPSAVKEDAKSVKLRMRSYRTPQIGDKFSSRHGQKGVVGCMINDEDMPFDPTTGIIPDIIINPHGQPSRMTLAHLREMQSSVAALLEGRYVDGTAFRNTTIEQVCDELKKHGTHPLCETRLVDGVTGEYIQNTGYMGMIYYQRLKHMPVDKIHARSRGPRMALTRQPVEGRSHEGGFRVGEMERDAIISHGASAVAADRLHEQSDAFETVICKQCGYIAERLEPKARRRYTHKVNNTPDYYCRYCKTSDFAVPIVMPYAMCLLVRELEAGHISVRFDVNDDTGTCSLVNSASII